MSSKSRGQHLTRVGVAPQPTPPVPIDTVRALARDGIDLAWSGLPPGEMALALARRDAQPDRRVFVQSRHATIFYEELATMSTERVAAEQADPDPADPEFAYLPVATRFLQRINARVSEGAGGTYPDR